MLPISDRHAQHAQTVADALTEAGLRTKLDDSSETVNNRIRKAQLQKIPYMLVIGDREQEAHTVSVRCRTRGNIGAMPLEAYRAAVLDEIHTRGASQVPEAAKAKA